MFKKSPSKSKKSVSREREKKKITHLGEPSSSSSNSSSIEKMQYATATENVKIYTGFGPETVQCVAEQFLGEKVIDQICQHLAEDVTFRMREILQSAAINMRQSKRNYLRVDDIDDTFTKFNIEKVYGPSDPNWVTFGDPDNLSCIPEKPVDLFELAMSDLSLSESGDIGINYQWLTDTSLFNNILITNSLNNYSDKIMNAAVSHKKSLRMMALKDVSRNVNIGPIIPQLCNFCFLILQKNITYSSLTAPTLQFLEAIMFNPCTSYSVEENQITLLIYLLLENIMNATNSQLHDVVPICRTLGRLCTNWIRGNQIVIEKINKYLLPEEPVKRLSAPVICALTYIGGETLDALLWTNIQAMFRCLIFMEIPEQVQIQAAILSAASIFYKQENFDLNVDQCLREEFADRLLPIWQWKQINLQTTTINQTVDGSIQSNWINIKMAFLKTLKIHSQQSVLYRTPQFKVVFKKSKPVIKPRKMSIIGASFKPLVVKEKRHFDRHTYYLKENKLNESVNIVTGRRTLCILKKSFSVNNVSCKKNLKDMLYML